MSNVTLKDDLAKIAIAKNLIKEYTNSKSERTVYLNDGTEFQIYLKNPYQTHLGIKIYVNNQSIGNMLVLKPGQSCWLERYMNENRKFLFSTYEVDNTPEMRYAIDKNGWVKLEFYHEMERSNAYVYPSSTITWTGGPGNSYDLYSSTTGSAVNSVNTVITTSGVTGSISDDSKLGPSSCCYNASSNTLLNIDCDINANKSSSYKRINKSIETGRVEKGSRSKQEFEYCDIDFDYYSFKTESIHILPTSQKKVNVEETRRRYCSQCGKKVGPKDKFCSNCGAKLT